MLKLVPDLERGEDTPLLEEVSKETLLERVATGDRVAFGELYEQTAPEFWASFVGS